ncbi:MAG: 5'-3' exonuclease [Synergistales bacterium]|nr:5'-3' exonuclease [Synergistales bacterium]
MTEIILIDGNYFAFRAFYGFSDFQSSCDEHPVNAVYGFGSFLVDSLAFLDPQRIAVVFDAPGHSFRKVIFRDYKAQRPTPPVELTEQFPLIEEFLDCLGIPYFSMEGVEGDDLIASLALDLAGQGQEVGMISADKDLFQLLANERLTLFRPGRGHPGNYEKVNRDSFTSKFGFPPAHHVDYLALVGDRVDNVPGVRGIGHRGASRLVSEHGSLENIYQELDSLPSATRKKLETGKEMAFLSKTLVTLKTDLDVRELSPGACSMDRDELYCYCMENSLQSLYHKCLDCSPGKVLEEVYIPF